MKQKEGESLQDYTRRFKTSRDILESHIGSGVVLRKVVQAMPHFEKASAADIERMTQETSERLFAFIYLENADQAKYGSILTNLNSQKSLGNDQYPRTITETNNVLSNHKFDPSRVRNSSDRQQKGKEKKDGSTDEDDEKVTLSFTQLEGKCYCCGKPGHKSPDCRQKNKIDRDDWAINKAKVQMLQSENKDEESKKENKTTEGTKNEEAKVGWASVHY